MRRMKLLLCVLVALSALGLWPFTGQTLAQQSCGWSSVGGGIRLGSVRGAASTSDGDVYVVGSGLKVSQTTETPSIVMRYRNGAWESLISTTPFSTDYADAIVVQPDAQGRETILVHTHADVRRFDGQQWTVAAPFLGQNMIAAPNGDLLASSSIDGKVWIRRWNGSAVSTLPPLYGGVFGFNVAANGDVLACGAFRTTLGGPVTDVARFDGMMWTPLNTGTPHEKIAILGLPNGDIITSSLFAVSFDPMMLRYTNGAWQPIPGTLPFVSGIASIDALARLPSGDLIAAGAFSDIGGVTGVNIARFDGSRWFPLGFDATPDSQIQRLTITPDGDVLAIGPFTTIAGLNTRQIARWTPQAGASVLVSPSRRAACPGLPTTLIFGAAPRTGGGPLAYSWEYQRNDPEPAWVAISPVDGATSTDSVRGISFVASGARTPALTLSNFQQTSSPPSPQVALRLRCVARDTQNACAGVISAGVTYTVCITDLDCSGIVNLDDVFLAINLWFARDARMDIDADGRLSLDDLLGFVEAWFRGCR